MKKIITLLIFSSVIFSCKNTKEGWTQKDKDTFMRDCMSVDKSDENERRCECGLNVMMKKYKSLDEAQNEVQKMDQEALESMLEDCSY